VFYFCQFLEADVSAHSAFLSRSVQCHLLSICCTFVIGKINDDDDDDDDDDTKRVRWAYRRELAVGWI